MIETGAETSSNTSANSSKLFLSPSAIYANGRGRQWSYQSARATPEILATDVLREDSSQKLGHTDNAGDSRESEQRHLGSYTKRSPPDIATDDNDPA